MALEIRRNDDKAMSVGLGVDRRLYLTRDKSRVVEHHDSEAAWLFATPGTDLSPEDVAAYGLSSAAGKIVLPVTAAARGEEATKKAPERAAKKDEGKAHAAEK